MTELVAALWDDSAWSSMENELHLLSHAEAAEQASGTAQERGPDQELEQWLANQRSATRISPAAEARTLLSVGRYCCRPKQLGLTQ